MGEGPNRSAQADLHGKAVVTRKLIEGDASIACFDERDDAGFIRDVRVTSLQTGRLDRWFDGCVVKRELSRERSWPLAT